MERGLYLNANRHRFAVFMGWLKPPMPGRFDCLCNKAEGRSFCDIDRCGLTFGGYNDGEYDISLEFGGPGRS
jgi:hypothetical protein